MYQYNIHLTNTLPCISMDIRKNYLYRLVLVWVSVCLLESSAIYQYRYMFLFESSATLVRVFSCPDNRGSAPISGQMAKVLRFSSDFCFSHKILRVLPYEKIGAHRIKAIFHEF